MKEQFIINYCKNTAINGFEIETYENEGEQMMATKVIEKIINDKYSLDELNIFLNGIIAMSKDIKLKIKEVNNDDFYEKHREEINTGIFSSEE